MAAGTMVSLVAPIGVQAADVNLEDMNSYSNSSRSKRFTNNFSSILPGDWAYQPIKDLVKSKACDAEISNNGISRYEAASIINSCLGDVATVTEIEKKLINEFSSELATLKGRVDGIEARVNNFEAGGFSDTTSMGGKAVFVVGGVEDSTGELTEGVVAQYQYTMDLNSSFTGDDNLYVRLRTGNALKTTSGGTDTYHVFSDKGNLGTYLSASTQYADAVKVDKIWYTFPMGDNHTFWVGPKIENYYMHATTPSIYKPITKQFALGGNAAAYGASTDSGVGWAYRADNGFAVSSNVVSKQNGSTKGFLTNEASTSFATQVGLTKPQYSVSAIVNMKYNGWTDGYFSTDAGKARMSNSTNVGLRGWWRPEQSGTATPEITLGYDFSEGSGAGYALEGTDMYFVGLSWLDMFQADDRIGIALGQPQTRETESGVSPFAWEAYYEWKVNDSVSISPAIFGSSDRNGTANTGPTGYLLQTTFKF